MVAAPAANGGEDDVVITAAGHGAEPDVASHWRHTHTFALSGFGGFKPIAGEQWPESEPPTALGTMGADEAQVDCSGAGVDEGQGQPLVPVIPFKMKWNAEQLQHLERAIAQHGGAGIIDWTAVGSLLGRSPSACSTRALRLRRDNEAKPKLKQKVIGEVKKMPTSGASVGLWTAAEDESLRRIVKTDGTGSSGWDTKAATFNSLGGRQTTADGLFVHKQSRRLFSRDVSAFLRACLSVAAATGGTGCRPRKPQRISRRYPPSRSSSRRRRRQSASRPHRARLRFSSAPSPRCWIQSTASFTRLRCSRWTRRSGRCASDGWVSRRCGRSGWASRVAERLQLVRFSIVFHRFTTVLRLFD